MNTATATQKLIFFDLDGTLVDGLDYIYQHLWEHFGVDKSRPKAALERYLGGEITYPEWIEHDVALFREVGATKLSILEAIKVLYPMEGVFEVLETLSVRGHKLFVLSGSMDILVGAVLGDSAAVFEDVFINRYVFDAQGHIVRAIPTKYDMEHKATCIKDMAQKYGVDIADCVFIGDNVNDVHAAFVAGTSIAFNCKSDELAQAATHHVVSNDLRDILPHIA
jgi:HAD superfamily phosphoserine phosphatase-like hydrolase